MSTRQHASRSSAQKSLKCGSKSPFNESRKMKTNKECVGDAMGEELDDGDVPNHRKLSEIYSMLKTVMAKLQRRCEDYTGMQRGLERFITYY